jgi:hypothetical protein
MNLHYAEHPSHMISVSEVVSRHFSHVFSYPRDYYMTSLLKEAAKDTAGLIAFVGAPHFYPLMKLWSSNTSFTEACKVPERQPSDSAETLIEKHAILDFLFETEIWDEPYILNAFPYLGQLDEIQKDLPYFKAYFLKMFRQQMDYTSARVLIPKQVEEELKGLLLSESGKADEDNYEFEGFIAHKTTPY